MRKGDAEFGIWEMVVAILAVVILVIFALFLFGVIKPGTSSSTNLGDQIAGVLNR